MPCKRSISPAADDGFAIVFAIQVLAVMTLMVAAAMASTVSLRDTTARDVSSKEALASALSGLDVARYRLEMVDPADNMCLTGTAVATGSGGAATGECPAYSGDLGNGAGYTYTVTPAISSGRCGGQTITSSTSTNRCITAVGTANGVSRRVQTLVSRGQVGTALFPFNGMVGLSGISINESNHGTVIGQVASNGSFALSGCSTPLTSATTWAPGPTATLTETCAGSATQLPPRSTPWSLQAPDAIYAGTETINDNATVFNSASGFDYTASTRVLKDSSNATLIINGSNPRTGSNGIWTFNLCQFTLTHVTQFKLQNGATARFLIDSNQRAGSGCGSAGVMNMTNIAGMNYDSTTGTPGNSAQLQFFFYGTGTINITNQSGMSAALYAPAATLKVTNQTKWIGAIAADRIDATNGLDFSFSAGDVSGITGTGTPQPWARSQPGFVECRASATTPTDPESGC
jgi:Tfp pilus assembly protein PilX